jgi:hypothetical protein
MKSFIAGLIILLSFAARAQELNAVVEVNYQNLPIINKESLGRFAQDVQTYLNNTKFTGQDWKFERINCQFNISITSASDEVTYSAQVVVVSQRKLFRSKDVTPMLRVFDNNWNFIYEKNQSLLPNPNIFSPLTSFLDYYAFIIIGMENDSWDKLGGTAFYSRANDIVNLAASSAFAKGWESTTSGFNRRDLVENALNEKYRIFREGIADYHYALDKMAQTYAVDSVRTRKINEATALIVRFIKSLETIKSKIDVRSIFIRTFFDAKYLEIIERLKNLSDKSVFITLKSIDPPHAAKYDEVLRR